MPHTPGPWRRTKIGNPYNQFMIYTRDGNNPIANTVQGEDNANLIAAAPEMLEALEELVKADDVKMGRKAVALRLDIARAAITKAKGE